MTAEAENPRDRDARMKRELDERQREEKRKQEAWQAKQVQAYQNQPIRSKQDNEDYQNYSRAEASGEPTTLDDIRSQKDASRKMGALQKVARAKESGEIGELALKDLRSAEAVMKHLQTIYRVINGASAITIIGIIWMVIVLNVELFRTWHLLPFPFIEKFIPKLSKAEQILTVAIDILVIISMLIPLALFIIYAFAIYYIMHPDEYYKWLFEDGGALETLYKLLKEFF